jgi:CRP-like cAMP-binding protein
MASSIGVAKTIQKNRQLTTPPSECHHPQQASDFLRLTKGIRPADRLVKAGCDLFRHGERGDALYCLVDGWVALYSLLENGRRQILQFALPGTVLAFVPMRGGTVRYSAQVLTDSIVCIIPHASLGKLCKENHEMGMRIAGLVSQERNLAYDHLSTIGRRSAKERVAYLLLELFMRSRMRWPGHRGEEMCLPLTQEHIGDATGLTGIHVNRMLQDLRKEGILEFHYRRLRILDPDKLVDVAGIDPHVALAWINHEASEEYLAHEKGNSAPAVIPPGRHAADRHQRPQLSAR